MQRQPFARIPIVLMAVAVAGASTTSLSGNDSPSIDNESRAVRTVAEMPPGTAALRAYRNPETGALDIGVAPLSGLSLDAETQNALRRDTIGLVEVHHPDGSVSIDLQGRFQCATVARIDGTGKVIVCTDGVESAQHALHDDAAGSATPEVK